MSPPPVSWSQLSSAQRAFLGCGARFNRDTIRNGKVHKRGEAKNPKALVMLASFAIAKDQSYQRDRLAREANLTLLESLTPEQRANVTRKVKPGRAYGASDLSRKRGRALPMRYFDGVVT